MAITIGCQRLTVDDVVAVARHGERVELAPEASERIRRCRGFLEKRIAAREIMYGVNTGIGEFSEVVLSDEQVGLVPCAVGGSPNFCVYRKPKLGRSGDEVHQGSRVN